MNNKITELYQDFLNFSKLIFSSDFNTEKELSIRGQTLVEFMLLLFIIVFISTFFMKIINHNISSYWRYFVSVIVDDKTVSIKY